MRKKACVFALLSLLLLSACSQEKGSIVGTWELPSEYISVIGEGAEGKDPADIYYSYTFCEDGTGEEYFYAFGGELENTRTLAFMM